MNSTILKFGIKLLPALVGGATVVALIKDIFGTKPLKNALSEDTFQPNKK